MAVNWGQMAETELNGDSWQESIALFKLSNVLGFNLSNVLGFYFSNYGFMKTQLMLGLERKINLAWKYEWYLAQPTKVLVNGEGKIDMDKSKKATPYWESVGLVFSSTFQSRSVKYFADDVKKADEKKWIAATSQMTTGTQNVTVTTGDSAETIAVGDKTITATLGGVMMTGMQGVTLMQSEGSWLEITAAGCTVTAPVINLG